MAIYTQRIFSCGHSYYVSKYTEDDEEVWMEKRYERVCRECEIAANGGQAYDYGDGDNETGWDNEDPPGTVTDIEYYPDD